MAKSIGSHYTPYTLIWQILENQQILIPPCEAKVGIWLDLCRGIRLRWSLVAWDLKSFIRLALPN